MNDAFAILIEQIAYFIIYMTAGVVLVKTKVLNEKTLEPISKFVIRMALPLLIFTNTINGVDSKTLLGTLPLLAVAAVMYLVLSILSYGMAKCFKLKGDINHVYRALATFGNIGFMGIPILSNLFPERGMLYIALVTIVDQLILWTLGVRLTTPESANKGGFTLKKMINPANTAIVLAVVFVLCKISLPGILNTAFGKIGATATPLAMIYLGGVFACMDIRKYLGRIEFYGIVAVKMLLFPFVFYTLLRLIPISEEIRMTVALLSAMPSMSSIVMMAKSSGSEGDYAVGGIFVTTICSIVTLPLVSWMIQTFVLV